MEVREFSLDPTVASKQLDAGFHFLDEVLLTAKPQDEEEDSYFGYWGPQVLISVWKPDDPSSITHQTATLGEINPGDEIFEITLRPDGAAFPDRHSPFDDNFSAQLRSGDATITAFAWTHNDQKGTGFHTQEGIANGTLTTLHRRESWPRHEDLSILVSANQLRRHGLSGTVTFVE